MQLFLQILVIADRAVRPATRGRDRTLEICVSSKARTITFKLTFVHPMRICSFISISVGSKTKIYASIFKLKLNL